VDPVNALSLAIADEPDIELAVVFGSIAQGRARRESDVDVGVLGDLSNARLSTLAVHLSRVARRQVDLIALDQAPPLLRFEVARTGQLLFERQPSLWTNFKVRAMVDWWDWAPYARRFAAAAAVRLRAGADDGAA
jgi:predicted nucleotidyltransferase